MPYVFSTLTADQAYTIWEKGGGDLPVGRSICVIKGGANVANKHFVTRRGVATQVTDAQLEALNKCDAYLRHKKAGYITEDKQPVEVDRAVANMNPRDGSAPLTDKDFTKEGKPAPKVNRKAKEQQPEAGAE